MAPADRPTSDHLTFLAEAAGDAHRYGLLALVRGAEARAKKMPKVGQSKRPSQNIVDLGQAPMLAFPGPTLDSIVLKGGRARVSGYWLGLTGPMGPLPTHLTEFAVYEKKYAKSRPFGDFLDMISGRMLQLFYRAWADSQPAALAERPDDDRFGAYLAALSGATEGVGERAAFPAKARLHYAALFAGRRSAAALEDALTHLLGIRAEVREFQPRWRDIEREDQSRVGRAFATLGGDLLLGRRVYVASDAFRVVMRVKNLAEFQSLLPSGARFAIAAEALDAFAPSHLEWDLVIGIDEAKVVPTKLDGRARLGWTSWLAPSGEGGLRTHVRLRRNSLKISKQRGGLQ